MAKNKKEKLNYKNVKVNQEELSITKIGEITTNEQSPTFVLILFGLLLAFIFFLPTIVEFVKGNNDKPDYSLNGTTNKKNEELEEIDNSEIDYYTFSDSLSIDLEENIKIDGFSLNGNALTFNVTNTSNARFYFNKNNYFLELYSEDNTLLERILLDAVVSRESSETLSYTVSASTALNMKKLIFVKKEVTDYPNVELEKNENQEEVLTCTKDTENLTYKFQNEKLFSITDVVNYSSNVSNYSTLLNEWKTRSADLNNVEGINSIFVDAGNGFVVNTTIDLKKTNVSQVDNVYYYTYETLSKVVNFEMKARGFSCK